MLDSELVLGRNLCDPCPRGANSLIGETITLSVTGRNFMFKEL